MCPLDPSGTYVMALDGDVAFKPEAVRLVLNRLERNMDVAAACNQIKPSGNGWLVWFQRFEYAVGHWLQKTTEHVLGCVLCSPGCFSIIRCSFLSKEVFEEPAPIDIYKSHAKSPRQKLMYDQVINTEQRDCQLWTDTEVSVTRLYKREIENRRIPDPDVTSTLMFADSAFDEFI